MFILKLNNWAVSLYLYSQSRVSAAKPPAKFFAFYDVYYYGSMPITKMKKGWPTLTTPLPFNGISVSAVPVGPREAGGLFKIGVHIANCNTLWMLTGGSRRQNRKRRRGRRKTKRIPQQSMTWRLSKCIGSGRGRGRWRMEMVNGSPLPLSPCWWCYCYLEALTSQG